jgi:hypothetical protein
VGAGGRRSRNLYHRGIGDEVLQEPLGHLRSLLGLPCKHVRPTLADVAAFGRFVAATLVLNAVGGVLALGLAAVVIRVVAGFAP